MRKIRQLIVGVLLLFGLSSCNSNTNHFTSGQGNSEIVEGGQNSKVVGTYFFESFSEYSDFYNVFKINNYQRYWTPLDSDKFNISYCFKTEGIDLEDANNKRYDLVFPRQRMLVEISNASFLIDLSMYDINEFDNETNLLNLSFSDIWDELEQTNVSNIKLICNDSIIGTGKIILDTSKYDLNYDDFNEILLLFKGGLEYVF